MDFSDIAARLSGSPLTALPLLFGAGVLTSLTPCVYPMIPITSAIVGGGAIVRAFTTIGEYEVWAGVPAKKIKDLPPVP